MVVGIKIKYINAEIVICCVNISMARYAQTINGDSFIDSVIHFVLDPRTFITLHKYVNMQNY